MIKREPTLDGVRGTAILLVLFAHFLHGAPPSKRPAVLGLRDALPWGGITGVQLFFALSGFLITSILLAELRKSRTVRLGRFWWRRLRRLYPPLIALCLVHLVVVILYRPARGPRWEGLLDIGMAMSYSTNFVSMVVPDQGWLDHTWSLAVEEQFYLVWPVLLLLVVPRFGVRTVAWMIASAVVVTVALRMVPSPETSGLVLRWDALLLGALVATRRWHPPPIVSWLGLIALLVMSVVEFPLSNWLYLASAVASACVVAGSGHLRFMAHPVLVHFGFISYSLYLWHAYLMRFEVSPWITFPVSLVVAELSYRFVERRFMANPPPLEADVVATRWRRLTARQRTPT